MGVTIPLPGYYFEYEYTWHPQAPVPDTLLIYLWRTRCGERAAVQKPDCKGGLPLQPSPPLQSRYCMVASNTITHCGKCPSKCKRIAKMIVYYPNKTDHLI